MRRRAFLASTGATIGGSRIAMSLSTMLATWATACRARDGGEPFRVLSVAEATELEAIAGCIIPADDTPGAVEAGVIHFIDAALAGFEADSVEGLRQGLGDLQGRVRGAFGEPSFAAIDGSRQVAVLREIEDSDFFRKVRYLTVAGMFSHPSYGGNRNEVGWKLIGFDGQQTAPPPFGYYDADYAEKGA